MRRALSVLAASLVGGCAGAIERVALSPCPPGVLPVCHAETSACAAPPFCYRTLGNVDCYATPERARRTVEEVVAPSACTVAAVRRARPG